MHGNDLYSLTECTLDYDHCQVNWFTGSRFLCYEPLIDMITYKAYGIS